ncbi:unnamed protein product [Malus baccata var. baccata]
MEEFLWYSLALIIFTLLLTLSIPKITQKHKKTPPPPSSPPSLPIIGHLHLIKQPIHPTLQPLNSNFSKVLLLRWGSRRVLLISSPSVAEEIFTKHDITFASRPRLLAGKHFNYNFTTVTVAPYGDLWRNLRRVMTLKVFSSSCLAQFSSLRQGEVRLLLNQTMKSCTDKVPKGMDITGTKKKTMSLMAKLDSFLQGLVDERRESLSADSACNGKDVKKLMIDNLLALQEKEPQFYTDQSMKGILLVMLVAGTDTSSATLEWAMALLLNHPEEMEKQYGYDLSWVGEILRWSCHGFRRMGREAVGGGRRGCPGAGLGKRLIALALASLVQSIECERISEEKVDMSEALGLTMPRAEPLEAMCKSRPSC